MNYNLNTGKLGLIFLVTISTLSFTLFQKLLLPFGDEPDWGVRTEEFFEGLGGNLSITGLFRKDLDLKITNCVKKNSSKTLFPIIESSCSPDERTLIIIWINAAFNLFLYLTICISIFKLRLINGDLQFYALIMSILIPSTIYYTSLISNEVYFYLLSFLFILTNKKSLLFILGILLTIIDFGNSLVIFAFLAYRIIFLKIYDSKRFHKFYYPILLSAIASTFMLSFSLFENLAKHLGDSNILASKFISIVSFYSDSDVITKYPLILRPGIPLLSSVLFTPSGIKVLTSTLVLILFPISVRKNLINNNTSRELNSNIILPLSFICSVVFIMPGYGNFKYYIFFVPILLIPLLRAIGPKRLFFNIIIFNALITFELVFYLLISFLR